VQLDLDNYASDRTPVAPTTEKGFAVFNESNQLPCEYERDLDAWICAWYDAAVARDFVRSPYHPDVATVKRLQGYFHARLSPAEAAEACFGRKH
jgi:hypothetical protein